MGILVILFSIICVVQAIFLFLQKRWISKSKMKFKIFEAERELNIFPSTSPNFRDASMFLMRHNYEWEKEYLNFEGKVYYYVKEKRSKD